MCAVCEFTNHRTSECEQENATTFKMSKSNSSCFIYCYSVQIHHFEDDTLMHAGLFRCFYNLPNSDMVCGIFCRKMTSK